MSYKEAEKAREALRKTADRCLNHAAATGFVGTTILATGVGILPYASMPIGFFTIASGASCLAVAFRQAATGFVAHNNAATLEAATIIQQSFLPPR